MTLDRYLRSCRELARLCTQNGWIDNDTLRYEILERSGGQVTAAVYFEEIVMEGSGCVADRVQCYGRVRIGLDGHGQVQTFEVL